MDGRPITGTDFLNTVSRPEPAPIGSPPHSMTSFMHPDEVVSNLWLTPAEKRAVLASWASDVRTVWDAPLLRQLDNGAVVRIDDVLRALRQLDNGDEFEHTTSGPFRPFADLRIRFPTRLKSALRRDWPDDDDPPPCPATIAGPLGGPRSGGRAADLALVLPA